MAFIDKATLGNDPVWRARCQVASCIAAADVSSEETTTPGHDVRAAYATRVLNQSATMSGPIAMAVAAAPAITGSDATDQDIQFTINSLWDALAGNNLAS